LTDVKKRTLEIFENQEYPFEDLVDSVSVRRDLSRNPLFDVMFTFQNMITEGVETIPADLDLKPYPGESSSSVFDITLTAVETEGQLFFTIEYCTKLFKAETIERFAGYFKEIVSVVVENPEVRIADMDIIPEREKEQILYTFNDTDVEYPYDKTIHELFEEQAARTGDNIALVSHGAWRMENGGTDEALVSITYRELK